MNTLDKLLRSVIWAIALMFVVGVITIAVTLSYGDGIGKPWHGGALLKTATGTYECLMIAMMAYMLGHRSHPAYMLLPVFPGTFFISIDPMPPQGLVYCLMLLYLVGMVYWTLSERERHIPEL